MNNIKDLLEIVINRKASDLHLVVDSYPGIRIYGELQYLKDFEILSKQLCQDLIFSILSEEQKKLIEENKEIDFSLEIKGTARFRVNVYYQKGTLSASFRYIPMGIKKIDELGLPSICHEFTKLKQGFILITGPTGHGKSTTLAAIIDEIINTRACHIVTIEDPVEFVFQSKKSLVSQRELGQDTNSWQKALKSALREDPDVVLIGEMRDYETIAAALTIADTGHLVFSTLHTNSAGQTVDRIIDAFPDEAKNQVRIQLSACLEAVLSQRLIPAIAGGRKVACEIMIANSAIKTVIRESKTHMIDNIIQTSANVGMISMEKTLSDMVKKGVISLETARLYALRPEEVNLLLRKN